MFNPKLSCSLPGGSITPLPCCHTFFEILCNTYSIDCKVFKCDTISQHLICCCVCMYLNTSFLLLFNYSCIVAVLSSIASAKLLPLPCTTLVLGWESYSTHLLLGYAVTFWHSSFANSQVVRLLCCGCQLHCFYSFRPFLKARYLCCA